MGVVEMVAYYLIWNSCQHNKDVESVVVLMLVADVSDGVGSKIGR